MITPVIINRLQWKAYLIFMCTNLAFIPLVYFCYPETAKLTLEEIDLLYTQPGVPARKVAKQLQRERLQQRQQQEQGDKALGSAGTDSERDEKAASADHAENAEAVVEKTKTETV